MPIVANASSTVGGGTIIATAVRTLINGVPAALLGDGVTPHGPKKHKSARVTQGSVGFLIEGRPVVVSGCKASCDHAVVAVGTVISTKPFAGA